MNNMKVLYFAIRIIIFPIALVIAVFVAEDHEDFTEALKNWFR